MLGNEYQQRTSPGKRSELQRTVSRAPKKIAMQPLKAGASVCPGGVLEDNNDTPKQIRLTRAPDTTFKQLTVMRPKIETGLQPLGAAADACLGGVKDIKQIARNEGLKAVAEVAEHEAELKMMQIEDAEQLELADDDDVMGLPLDQHALDDLC